MPASSFDDTGKSAYLFVLLNHSPKPGEIAVAVERRFPGFSPGAIPESASIRLFIKRFSKLARVLLLDSCVQFRTQPHQASYNPVTRETHPMLKSFMQPGSGNQAKTDSTRTIPSAYASSRTTDAPKPAESSKEEAVAVAKQHPRNDEGSKLIVGPNIKLKGSEITDCEILVVEGRVEASMNSRDIRIAEGGVFSGKAEIDVAEVRGVFEGEITARKRLVIYASGKVSGTIRYGSLMIEEGGTLSGDVAPLSAAPSMARVPDASVPIAAPDPVEEQVAKLEQVQFGSTLVRNQAGKRQG